MYIISRLIILITFFYLFHFALYRNDIRYCSIRFTLLSYIVIVRRSSSGTTSTDRAQSYENSFKNSFRIHKGNSLTKLGKCGRILSAALY